MQVGDLIRFKQIAPGKYDDPPYSLDDTWRIGLLLEYTGWVPAGESRLQDKGGLVLYRGRIYEIRAGNMEKIVTIGKNNEAR